MNITRLDHVAIVSDDSTASRNWYIRVFDMEWVYKDRWEGNPIFLKKGDALIAIFQNNHARAESRGDGPGIAHFAFNAATKVDYENIKLDLKRKGIAYKEQDHEISHSIYVQDPDDITVEVTTYDIS